jgi:hypothetical protein
MGSRNVPGLIKPIGKPPMFVHIHRDTIKLHPINSNLVMLKVLTGFKRRFKKPPMKLYEDFEIPKEWLFAYPGGIEEAMMDNGSLFVCGVRHECQQVLVEENSSLQRDLNDARNRRDFFKDKVEEMQTGINNVIQQIAKLGGTEAEKIMSSLLSTTEGIEQIKMGDGKAAKGKT